MTYLFILSKMLCIDTVHIHKYIVQVCQHHTSCNSDNFYSQGSICAFYTIGVHLLDWHCSACVCSQWSGGHLKSAHFSQVHLARIVIYDAFILHI